MNPVLTSQMRPDLSPVLTRHLTGQLRFRVIPQVTFLLTRELNRSLIPHLTSGLSRELTWSVSRTLKPEVTWGVTPRVAFRTAIMGVGSGKSPPARGLAEAVAGPEIRVR